jgi:predicted metallopeptidase
LILSPTRYGKPKNIIRLAVILLRIDHWAKSAIPITANTEDRKIEICEYSTPEIFASNIKKNPNIVIVIVLEIYLIL